MTASPPMCIDRDALLRDLFVLEPHHVAILEAAAPDSDSATATTADARLPLLQHARAHGQIAQLHSLIARRVSIWLRTDVVPVFWRILDSVDALSRRTKREQRAFSRACAEQLTLAIECAHDAFAHCIELANVFDTDDTVDADRTEQHVSMRDDLAATFRCLVFDTPARKERFSDILVLVFSLGLRAFRHAATTDAPAAFVATQCIRARLTQLQWTRVAEPALQRVLLSHVREIVRSTCSDEFAERCLDRVEANASSALLPWLRSLVQDDDAAAATEQQWRAIVSHHVLQEFRTLRLSQLFEIIKEFPDSVPALEDLRRCLERAHTQQQHDGSDVVESLRAAFQSRLLQPGANTSEILDIYVSTIKAFRLLDPKGVLLEALSEPVKEYLRQRKDTVRCIVTSLTDDQNGDLFDELQRNNLRLIQQDDDSDDDEDASPDDWEPDPIEADPTKTSRSRSSDDILRMLVNIYGSRELFVNEYRMMLADKLLQNVAYDTDRDVQTLELLKLRFGEDSLHECEIMVRDMDDSKRINANVRSTLATDANDDAAANVSTLIDAAIVSQHFWPPFQRDDFTLHPIVARDVERYKQAYAVLRNPRSLDWHASLGSVQLAIELDGVERDFTVSPIQASMILHFDGRDEWDVEALAAALEMDDDALLKHVTVWINHGLLTFSSDRKTLVAAQSFQDARGSGGDSDAALQEEPETAVSLAAQEAEDLRVLETYIVGMLSNFGSLPIQRIHNMLSTFARSGAQPYDKTISGLAVILGKLVDRRKIELVGGQYQRSK